MWLQNNVQCLQDRFLNSPNAWTSPFLDPAARSTRKTYFKSVTCMGSKGAFNKTFRTKPRYQAAYAKTCLCCSLKNHKVKVDSLAALIFTVIHTFGRSEGTSNSNPVGCYGGKSSVQILEKIDKEVHYDRVRELEWILLLC